MANRRKQIEALQQKASALADEFEALKDDMETSLENMPESLQFGERGQAMQEKIDWLDTSTDTLNEIAEEVIV